MCLQAGLTWVRVRFIPPFAVSALKHGCSEVLPTSQLIPTARASTAWAAAHNRGRAKQQISRTHTDKSTAKDVQGNERLRRYSSRLSSYQTAPIAYPTWPTSGLWLFGSYSR